MRRKTLVVALVVTLLGALGSHLSSRRCRLSTAKFVGKEHIQGRAVETSWKIMGSEQVFEEVGITHRWMAGRRAYVDEARILAPFIVRVDWGYFSHDFQESKGLRGSRYFFCLPLITIPIHTSVEASK